MVDSDIPSHAYWAPRNEITSNTEMDPACLVFSSGGVTDREINTIG